MALAVTGVAQAAAYLVKSESLMAVSLGSINNYPIPARGPGTVTLVDNGVGGHNVQIDEDVWATVNYSFGTSLYTGVPLIKDFQLTVQNAAMTATSNFTALNYLSQTVGGGQTVIGPGMGGQSPLEGYLYLLLEIGGNIPFPLALVGGAPGGTTKISVLGLTFSNTYGPWFTQPVLVTGITTNIVSWNGETGAGIELRLTPDQHGARFSTGGGFMTTNNGLPLEKNTITLSGANGLLSKSATGSLTIVSPMRIDTTPAVSGRVGGAAWMTLSFVPEPGTMLLLAAGAVGLIAIGRRRARK
jgi:hypothetical protein